MKIASIDALTFLSGSVNITLLSMADMGLRNIILAGALPLLAYLLGSIPWGLVIVRHVKAVDIRKRGSGNIGATNVGRLAGIPLGVLTLVLDMLKGAIPVYLAMILMGTGEEWRHGYIAFVTLVALMGHFYPLFLKFKTGGKGVATALGCFLIISPGASIIVIIIFFFSLWASKRVSVGSLVSSAALPPVVWLVTDSVLYSIGALTAAVFIFFRHRENIKRLMSGTEPPFRTKPPR